MLISLFYEVTIKELLFQLEKVNELEHALVKLSVIKLSELVLQTHTSLMLLHPKLLH